MTTTTTTSTTTVCRACQVEERLLHDDLNVRAAVSRSDRNHWAMWGCTCPDVVHATGRPEDEACQAGTPGCSVDHTASAPGTGCESW